MTDAPGERARRPSWGVSTVSGDDAAAACLVSSRARGTLAYEPGTEVARRFRVERLLGAGGMGEVYEATDTSLGQRVALKTVPERARDGSPAHADRLDRELVLARRIAHPNVCRAFDLGVDERGRRFVTMELVHGETLADRLARRGQLDPDEVRAIVRDIATGLIAAHAAGVIHRDLKPANVMITDEGDPRGAGRAVIMDFGLAHDDEHLTSVTHGAGTPAYMAPEQLAGRPASAATDVHALAVVAVELLTGRRPLGGNVATGHRRWDRLLRPCLAAEPAARPTARELLARLDRSPRRRWPGWVAAIVSLATTSVALVPVLRPGSGGTPAVRAPGTRFPLGFSLGGVNRDNVNALRWHPSGDLIVGGHAGPGARLAGVALGRDPDAERAGWVARVDPTGRPRWTWRTRGAVELRVIDLAVLPGGDVIVGGFYHAASPELGLPAPASGPDAYLLRLDGATGRLRWLRPFAATTDAVVRSIEIDEEGAVFVGGEFSGVARFGDGEPVASGGGLGSRVPFVAAYDGDGHRRWLVPGVGTGNARAFGLAVDRGTVWLGALVWGGVTIAGVELPTSAEGDGIVLGVDAATGARRWARVVEIDGSGGVVALAARDGRLLLGGNYRGVVRLDGYRLQTEAGLTGFVAELDPSTGAARWARSLEGAGTSNPCCLALTPDGHAFVAGKMTGELRAGALVARGAGDEDGFLLELDRDGQPLALDQLAGRARDRFRRLAIGGDGRLAAAAMFVRDTRIGALALASHGDVDGLIVHVDRSAVAAP